MKAQILKALEPFEFSQIGFVNHTRPLSLNFYEDWLNEGLNADMKYLKDHLEKKRDLSEFLPQAQSTIVITLDYFDHPKAMNLTPMKIASYAKGEDYHYFFKQKLNQACDVLTNLYPDHHFKNSTDSQPILERDFAHQAGLGWFGKNSCLIHQKKGSFFLIGEIVTTLNIHNEQLEKSERPDFFQHTQDLHPDRCGTCTKCIDACPTEALTPKTLDANKCISYWTIESKTVPSISLAKKFDDWFFGCDVCQDVCPWNIKLHSLSVIEKKNHTDRENVLKEILDILNSSNKSLEKRFFGTPLSRARGFGLKRNALIIAMNINAFEIKDQLQNLDLKNELLNNFKTEVVEVISIT